MHVRDLVAILEARKEHFEMYRYDGQKGVTVPVQRLKDNEFDFPFTEYSQHFSVVTPAGSFYFKQFPALCGVMLFYSFDNADLTRLTETWERIATHDGYTFAMCSVNNAKQRDQLLSKEWKVVKEFVNKRTTRRIWIMDKQTRQ